MVRQLAGVSLRLNKERWRTQTDWHTDQWDWWKVPQGDRWGHVGKLPMGEWWPKKVKVWGTAWNGMCTLCNVIRGMKATLKCCLVAFQPRSRHSVWSGPWSMKKSPCWTLRKHTNMFVFLCQMHNWRPTGVTNGQSFWGCFFFLTILPK